MPLIRPSRPTVCRFPDCGRRVSARGLCQTHNVQLKKTGTLRPIRRYRQRSTDTVPFSGYRLTPPCAEELESYAREHGLSYAAVITAIVERWARRRRSD